MNKKGFCCQIFHWRDQQHCYTFFQYRDLFGRIAALSNIIFTPNRIWLCNCSGKFILILLSLMYVVFLYPKWMIIGTAIIIELHGPPSTTEMFIRYILLMMIPIIPQINSQHVNLRTIDTKFCTDVFRTVSNFKIDFSSIVTPLWILLIWSPQSFTISLLPYIILKLSAMILCWWCTTYI